MVHRVTDARSVVRVRGCPSGGCKTSLRRREGFFKGRLQPRGGRASSRQCRTLRTRPRGELGSIADGPPGRKPGGLGPSRAVEGGGLSGVRGHGQAGHGAAVVRLDEVAEEERPARPPGAAEIGLAFWAIATWPVAVGPTCRLAFLGGHARLPARRCRDLSSREGRGFAPRAEQPASRPAGSPARFQAAGCRRGRREQQRRCHREDGPRHSYVIGRGSNHFLPRTPELRRFP